MAFENYKYLEENGLQHTLESYNDKLNERWKKRLKYFGDCDISVASFSFDSLAATKDTHVGDVYRLTNTTTPTVEEITISDITYAVNDWIVVMNVVAAGGTGVQVGKLGSQSSKNYFLIADDALPDTAKFKEDMVVYLKADEIDATTSAVTHKAGLWRYDFATTSWSKINEDTTLDVNYLFDNTLTVTYAGKTERIVDSKYLDDVLTDYTRYVAPFYAVEYKTYATKALLDAVDLTTLDDNKTYIITVTADETYPRGTIPETYFKTQYMVVSVKADAAGVPTRKLVFMGKLEDTGIEILRLD